LLLERFLESQIVANAFVMFAAGFETVSTAISFCLYELAFKKHIQDKVREEINLKLSKNDGLINNDLLIDLNYLDMVLAGNYVNNTLFLLFILVNREIYLYYNNVFLVLPFRCRWVEESSGNFSWSQLTYFKTGNITIFT